MLRVCRAFGSWQVSGLFGVWRAWAEGDYLVKRERDLRGLGAFFLILGET